MRKKLRHDSSVLAEATADLKERYEVLETIGQGTFGLVRKCRDKVSGQVCAVKTIVKSKVPSLEILRKEVELLSEVDHPHIIKLYDVFEEEKKLHLVTELCTGGELYDKVVEKSLSPEQHFSEYDAARILRNVLDAINYCHTEKNIVHRDLKVENFLLLTPEDDAPVKIIDFGLSRFNHDNIMTSRVGTVYYVAPEVFTAKEYGNKCDLWSIGVIAYVLLCGFPPFYGENEGKTLRLVQEGVVDFPSPIWDDVSKDAKQFILRLLNRDPALRPSAKEALEDPWLHNRQVQPPGISQRASFAPFNPHPPQKPGNSIKSTNTVSTAPVTPSSSIKQETDGSSRSNGSRMKNPRREFFQRFLLRMKIRKSSKTKDQSLEF